MKRSQPSPEAPGQEALSVTQLTASIKSALESAHPGVWVRGEVSNLRIQSSGHAYFTLKDSGAQIAAVLFRGDLARTGLQLMDGQQILAFGGVSVYEVRGQYQLIVRSAVDAGTGRLQAEFERLKRRLAAEGLFDPASKRPLPSLPERVGFITSPTGAAAQDFIRILERRGWRGQVVILPARVQGAEAPADLVRMLSLAQELEMDLSGQPVIGEGCRRYFDLLVIGRGGGSLEDLWSFNDESVVRAIAGCSLPVISAVGHEIDFTLADFAADVRAETPSAAAELLSSGFVRHLERTLQLGKDLGAATARAIAAAHQGMSVLQARLARQEPQRRVEQSAQRVDDLRLRLDSAREASVLRAQRQLSLVSRSFEQVSPARRIRLEAARLEGLARRLSALAPDHRLAVLSERLQGLGARLESLGPKSVLQRGFAIVHDESGAAVTKVRDAEAASVLEIEFHDGRLRVDAGRIDGGPGGTG